MSKYHAECSKGTTPDDTINKVQKCNPPKLKSKPFCDCNPCVCKDCPDILKMFSITITENSCDFGSKVCKACTMNECEKENAEEEAKEIASLLENINPNRECGCEVVARAVLSDVHTNLDLTEVRIAATSENTTSKNPEKLKQEQ